MTTRPRTRFTPSGADGRAVACAFAAGGAKAPATPDVVRRTATGFRRPAFIMTDMVLGLAVVLALSALVAGSRVWSRRAADGLADSRDAAAAAEAALVDMDAGRTAPPGVRVDPATGGGPVPGRRWVRVTATAGRHAVTLVGLVPDGGRR